MGSKKLSDLLDEIDSLISAYVLASASRKPEMILSSNVDIENILEHGAYPPSDPRSPSGAALLSIALQQKDRGGYSRLARLLAIYRQSYGPKRAAILNARWHFLAER